MGFSVSVKERRLILVLIVVIWCFITMGGVVNEAIWNLFNVTLVEKVPLNWGRVTARLGVSARRSFIALPHLSRFPVITRIQSRATIMRLLNDA